MAMARRSAGPRRRAARLETAANEQRGLSGGPVIARSERECGAAIVSSQHSVAASDTRCTPAVALGWRPRRLRCGLVPPGRTENCASDPNRQRPSRRARAHLSGRVVSGGHRRPARVAAPQLPVGQNGRGAGRGQRVSLAVRVEKGVRLADRRRPQEGSDGAFSEAICCWQRKARQSSWAVNPQLRRDSIVAAGARGRAARARGTHQLCSPTWASTRARSGASQRACRTRKGTQSRGRGASSQRCRPGAVRKSVARP